jgi:nucleotide-binding universal stress UspA family protein
VFKRILLPTDGSRCSEQAMGYGLELARALGASAIAVSESLG